MLKSRAVLNLTSNLVAMAASILLSLWLVPFMIRNVGSEAYSFIPLTQQMVNYMMVISVALTSMTGRFFTIAKTTGRIEDAQRYFNTSFFTSIFGSLVVGVLIIAGAVFINRFVNVPDYLLIDVQISFFIYGIIFLLGMLSASYSVAPFANNKLYLTSIANIVNVVVRTFLTMFLLLALIPRIWYVSLGALIASVATLVVSILFFKRLEPGMKLDFRKFDREKSKELISSGVWNAISQVGVILFLQVDMLVANWFLGPKAAGDYSAVLQWSALIRTFSSNITSIFGPTIVAIYAEKRLRALADYSNKAVNVTGLIMALPIGIISGMGGSLLGIWLDPGYVKYQPLLTLLTLHLSVNLSVQTLFSVQIATNKVKVPAIVSMVMGGINFILAIVFAHYFNMGVMGIALAGFLVLTAKNLFFTPIYTAHITNMPWYSYMKGVIRPIICTLIVWGLSYACQSLFALNSLLMFGAAALGISIIYAVLAYFIALGKDEKELLNKMLFRLAGKLPASKDGDRE